ncbi:hypothetical protein ACWPKO_22615 (plasmid) [Coraliomargarita sp. W4R53]
MKNTNRPSEPPPLTAPEQRLLDERMTRRRAALEANPQPEPIPGARTRHSRWDVRPTAFEHASDTDQWLQIIDTSRAIEPFDVRISEDANGRLIITGMHIVGDVEITARVLREIQPAKIVQTISWRETGSEPPPSVGDVSPITRLSRFEGVAVEIEQAVESAQPVESKRAGRPGPSDDALREIVAVYRRHVRATRNAIKATSVEQHRGRATVQRWLDLAHERGFFPEGRTGAQTTTREDER